MKLVKSLLTISSITTLSRILGFIRDIIIARIFGAEITTDIFFTVFKLPNLLRRIFAEGAFSQSFIPILSEYKNKFDKNKVRLFISHISGLLIILLIITTILGIIMAPWIIIVVAPGFVKESEKYLLATQLLIIVFPYIILISLASLVGSILNNWNSFFVPAFAPIFLNISMITFSIFAVQYFHPPILALAWAVIFGGILQLFYQLPFLKKIDMLILPKIYFYDTGVIKVLKRICQSILGISINYISIIINTILASFLNTGSISWIYYADRLTELPSGILGVTLGIVLIPYLSNSFSNGDHETYCRLIDWGLRICFLLVIPSAIGLGILAKPLVIALFQYGKFNSFDTLMTQQTLIFNSIGLFGLVLVKVLSLGFYSCKNIKTPLTISIVTTILTQFMNLLFIFPLKHACFSLSIGISAYINAFLLYWQLRKKYIFTLQPGWIGFLLNVFISVIVMTISLISAMNTIISPEWLLGKIFYRILSITILVMIGIISYFATLIFLKFNFKTINS